MEVNCFLYERIVVNNEKMLNIRGIRWTLEGAFWNFPRANIWSMLITRKSINFKSLRRGTICVVQFSRFGETYLLSWKAQDAHKRHFNTSFVHKIASQFFLFVSLVLLVPCSCDFSLIIYLNEDFNIFSSLFIYIMKPDYIVIFRQTLNWIISTIVHVWGS